MAAAADEAMEDLRILYEDKFLVLCVKPVGVLSEDSDTAAALQVELLPLIDLLFCEVNPIPVKAAMKRMGYDCGGCRMPREKS